MNFDLIKASQISTANSGGNALDNIRFVNGSSPWTGTFTMGFIDTNGDTISDTLRLSLMI
jgi:hypothetical protein